MKWLNFFVTIAAGYGLGGIIDFFAKTNYTCSLVGVGIGLIIALVVALKK